MWLRRQDELNEARPTERFSTAIRLLSGRAAMERRYAKELEQREAREVHGRGATGELGQAPVEPAGEPLDAVDLRAFADPVTEVRPTSPDDGPPHPPGTPRTAQTADAAGVGPARGREAPHRAVPAGAQQGKRARLLARRRRTTMVLFLAFTCGAVVAAVGGATFLWAPAVPAVLLSAYIAHMRAQERRRFVSHMDRRRAEEAARRPCEQGQPGDTAPATVRDRPSPPAAPASPSDAAGPAAAGAARRPGRRPGRAGAGRSVSAAERRALVEQTDHAEWVDQERERDRGRAGGDGWEPTPVPLPTYVNAPVAPRSTPGVDLDAPDAWSSGRAGPVSPPVPGPATAPGPRPGGAAPSSPSSSRGAPGARSASAARRSRARTPLYDQYADEDRPRAANE